MTKEERDEIIQKLVGEGIPMASISRIFGITRERVRQIWGDDRVSPTVVTLGGKKYDVQEVIDTFVRERSFHRTAMILGTSNQGLSILLRRLLSNEEVTRILQEERYERLKVRLKETLNGSNTISTSALLHLDPSLYQLLRRVKPLSEWAEDIGVVYVKETERPRRGEEDHV